MNNQHFYNTIALIIFLAYLSTSFGCNSNNCCNTGTCNNCCNTGVCNNCCNTGTCNNCCSHCCTPSTSTQSTSTPTIPSPFTYVPPSPGSSTNTSNVINNNNNGTVQTSFNINNTVTIVNNISVPISINNENKVDIRVSISSDINDIVTLKPENNSTTTYTSTTFTTTSEPTRNITIYKTVPVPIAIPMPPRIIYLAVPYPIRVPGIRYPGCCIVVNPCLYGDQCRPYTNMCGSKCTSNYMYTSSNPCLGGCNKRQYAPSYSCYNSGYCDRSMTDCNTCNDDFYTSFERYRQCGGCFSKM